MVPNLLNTAIVVLSAFSGVLCLGIQDAHSLQFCNELGCANNSSCRTTLTNNQDEGSHVTHSECICHGGWVGPKCNHRLSLKMEYIRGHVATLTADVITGSETQTRKPKIKAYRYNYKIQYWSNETGSLCNIMTDLTSKRFTVTGLLPARFYFICASAVTVDLCFYKDKDMLSIWPNCVLMNTVQSEESFTQEVENTSGVVAPLSLTVFFVIVLVLIVVVVIKCRTAQCRRNRFAFRNLLRPASTCPCFSKLRTETNEEPQTNSRLLPDNNEMSGVRVVGPYGEQRVQNKRTHALSNGTASYATRNDVRIPLTTIIEYTPEDGMDTLDTRAVITPQTVDREEKT